MENRKKSLTYEEQVQHLKDKGVKFEIVCIEDAKNYLRYNNNLFKLSAFRKNYGKHPDGIKKGKYINLDFGYLIDLAVIDKNLRYLIVHMALDVEHYTKLELLRKTEEKNEDGYQIVKDYIKSLDEKQKKIYESEISRNRGNIFSGRIIEKYSRDFPVWVFVEVIPFGRLVSFYGFCAKRFDDRDMKDEYYRLKTCKEIRNAAAHSSCILNELDSNTTNYNTNNKITKELMKIKGMKSGFRKNRMSNARIQQVITLFFVYKETLASVGEKKRDNKNIRNFVDRAYQNMEFYKDNEKVKSTFAFLKIVIDSWFSDEVE